MAADKTDTNQKDEFDTATQDQAYYELCQIIAQALQTQDLEMLQVAISYWENKYPVEKFDNSYKEKIKRLLSNEYLAWLSQYIQELSDIAKRCKEFDPVKAYDRLIKILVSERKTGNYERLKEKIDAWKIAYPLDKFSDYYQSKIKEKTSEKHLHIISELFSEKDALDELDKILSSANNISELKCRIRDWKQKFPEKGFSNKSKSVLEPKIANATRVQSEHAILDLQNTVANFKNDISSNKKNIIDLYDAVSRWQNENKFEDIEEQFYPVIRVLTDKGYLSQSIRGVNPAETLSVVKHVGPLNQEKACLELTNALLSGDYSQKVMDWIYKYGEYIPYFDDYHIGYILERTNSLYRLPKSGIKQISEIDLSSCDNLSDAKKAVTVQFLSHLYHKSPLLDIEKQRLQSVYAKTVIDSKKRETANLYVSEIKDVIAIVNSSIYPVISSELLDERQSDIVVTPSTIEDSLEQKKVAPVLFALKPSEALHEIELPEYDDKEIPFETDVTDRASNSSSDLIHVELNETAKKDLLDFTFNVIHNDFEGKKMCVPDSRSNIKKAEELEPHSRLLKRLI